MPIELEECTSKLGPLYSLSCTHCPLKCYNCLRMCSLYISMADARRFQSGDQMVHLQPRSSPSQTAKCSLPLFDVSWSAISEVRVGLGLRWGQKRGSDRRNVVRRITKLPGKRWGMTIVFPRTFWLGGSERTLSWLKETDISGSQSAGSPHHSAKPSIHPVFNLEGLCGWRAMLPYLCYCFLQKLSWFLQPPVCKWKF